MRFRSGVGPQTAVTWASSRFSLVTGGRDRAGPNGAGDSPGRAAALDLARLPGVAAGHGGTQGGSQECRAV
ncbi:hypothetical protein, partial [Streptomyces sp. JV178]|uniref:hypothetical protein n=1 Tax=Streptomyces sp. JV178 TaxID=858632 RepID=UPI001C559147